MKKAITGFCPVIESEHTIFMTYIDASTFAERVFVKDKAECSLRDRGMCQQKECPLKLSAPNEITAPQL